MALGGAIHCTRRIVDIDRRRGDNDVTALAAPSPSSASPMTKYV